MTSKEIIQQWMQASSDTLARHDVAAHMDLVSKDVKVFGVPGIDVMDYNDWESQCRDEFPQKLVKSVAYQGLKILEETPQRITFMTVETLTDAQGNRHPHGVEMILTKEADGQWRVTQQRVLSEEAARHANLE